MEPMAGGAIDVPQEQHATESPRALIMKGGGIKGLAYVGALEVLNTKYRFDWYIGTSAGAIAAVLLGAGFSIDELKDILKNKNFGDFFDARWYQQPFNFLFYKGLHKADTLTKWLDALISEKLQLNTRPKLSHLHSRVTIFASQRFTDALKFDRETNDVYASFAVRCSMSIPFVFTPQSDQGFRAYDGGIRHNYPVEMLLKEYPGTRFISLYLGSEVYKHEKERTVLSDLLSIATEATDAKAIQKYKEHTVIIDPHPIRTLDFTLSEHEKELLLQAGRVGALAHLGPDAQPLQEARAVLNGLRATVQVARDRASARRKRGWLFGAAAVCLMLLIGWWLWKSADARAGREHHIITQLDAALNQTAKDRAWPIPIEALQAAVADVRDSDVESSIEIMQRLVLIHGLLEAVFEQRLNFGQALQSNNQQHKYLSIIYRKKPSIVFEGRVPSSEVGTTSSYPIGVAIFLNRAHRAFLVYGERKSALDRLTLQQIRDGLASGDEALQKSDVKGLDAGNYWLVSCLSHWLNGDRDGASKALSQAISKVGPPGRGGLETLDRRAFFTGYFQFVAALDAMAGESKSALSAIDKVKEFWPDDINKPGRLGYLYLLIARGARLPETVQATLKSSKEYLESGDKCTSCCYNLACVLSKLSEITKGAEQESALRQAKEYFLFSMGKIIVCPQEPDIARVRADPFLTAIVSDSDIQSTLQNFDQKWKPPEYPVNPDHYGLWHLGIPLKRTRYPYLVNE
jgi:predicted acylesterase/phospholipase RssA